MRNVCLATRILENAAVRLDPALHSSILTQPLACRETGTDSGRVVRDTVVRLQ